MRGGSVSEGAREQGSKREVGQVGSGWRAGGRERRLRSPEARAPRQVPALQPVDLERGTGEGCTGAKGAQALLGARRAAVGDSLHVRQVSKGVRFGCAVAQGASSVPKALHVE